MSSFLKNYLFICLYSNQHNIVNQLYFNFKCILFKKYLFIGLVGSWVRHAGSFVAVHGLLSSCGSWALEHAGSVVAVRGLSSCGVWA